MDNLYSYYDDLDNHDEQHNAVEFHKNNFKSSYDMDRITPFAFPFICIITSLSIICCVFICYSICKSIINFGSNPITSPTAQGYSNPHRFRSLSTTSMLLTLFCVILYTICNILDPFAYYTRFMQYDAYWNDIIYTIYNLVWISSKLSFYIVLIHRYYLIYDASSYTDPDLNNKKLCIFPCFVIMLLLELTLYLCIFVVYVWYFNTNVLQCFTIMFLSCDLLMVVTLSCLFSSSVLKLVLQIQVTKEKNAIFEKRKKSVTIDDTLQTIDETMDNTINHTKYYSSHFKVDTLTNISMQSDIFNVMHKTNINLNANELSMLSAKHTLDTADVHHRYKFTSSSMPEYAPSNDDDEEECITKYDDIYNKQQIKLLNITTRIALTSFIALCSSFIYQLEWFIGFEMNDYSHLVWFNYMWCIDGIIAIICVYLQLEIAKDIYRKLCIGACRCHQCCFKMIHTVTRKRAQYNQNIRAVRARQRTNSVPENTVTSTKSINSDRSM